MKSNDFSLRPRPARFVSIPRHPRAPRASPTPFVCDLSYIFTVCDSPFCPRLALGVGRPRFEGRAPGGPKRQVLHGTDHTRRKKQKVTFFTKNHVFPKIQRRHRYTPEGPVSSPFHRFVLRRSGRRASPRPVFPLSLRFSTFESLSKKLLDASFNVSPTRRFCVLHYQQRRSTSNLPSCGEGSRLSFRVSK